MRQITPSESVLAELGTYDPAGPMTPSQVAAFAHRAAKW